MSDFHQPVPHWIAYIIVSCMTGLLYLLVIVLWPFVAFSQWRKSHRQ